MVEPAVQDVNLEQNVQLQNQQQPTPDPNAFVLPDTYKDKPYLKDVKSLDDVYKKLDGAQNLIGQKITFPTDQSTAEELLKFNRSAGMPEKANEYAFEKIGEKEREIDVDNKFKEIFHKYGLSGKAATGIQKDTEMLVAEVMKERGLKADATFDELTLKTFGDKADEVLASGKKLIEENIPEGLAEDFTKLPNNALVIMSGVLDNVRKKYIGEDTITQGDRVSASGKKELQDKSDELMNHPAYKDGMHKEHKIINDQIKEISQKLAKFE